MTWRFRYPKIPHLERVRPNPRVLLGRRLFWTKKYDGSCIATWLKEDVRKSEADFTVHMYGRDVPCKVMISSRNLEQASDDLVQLVKSTREFPKIVEWLKSEPYLIFYVEACRKGRSVTGAEVYDRNMLIMFDIANRICLSGDQKIDPRIPDLFFPYTYAYQQAYQHKIPFTELYAETRHTSMKDLLKFRNHAIEHCKAVGWEGMVVKCFSRKYGYIQCKVKVDIPQPVVRKIAKGEPVYPEIPESEIMGAIDKVWQELGTEQFEDPKIAMPLIAKYVAEECKKHFYSKPKGKKLYLCYQRYLERHLYF